MFRNSLHPFFVAFYSWLLREIFAGSGFRICGFLSFLRHDNNAYFLWQFVAFVAFSFWLFVALKLKTLAFSWQFVAFAGFLIPGFFHELRLSYGYLRFFLAFMFFCSRLYTAFFKKFAAFRRLYAAFFKRLAAFMRLYAAFFKKFAAFMRLHAAFNAIEGKCINEGMYLRKV